MELWWVSCNYIWIGLALMNAFINCNIISLVYCVFLLKLVFTDYYPHIYESSVM